jgi:hypothetical protein
VAVVCREGLLDPKMSSRQGMGYELGVTICVMCLPASCACVDTTVDVMCMAFTLISVTCSSNTQIPFNTSQLFLENANLRAII